jgi:hypothetical protein
MSAALAGVAGVLLGALISTGSNWLIEARRTRRADQREARKDERQLLQAIRLIDDEITDIAYSLCIAIDNYEWWPRSSFTLPSNRWNEYGPILAGSGIVTENDWSGISTAYQVIRGLNAQLACVDTNINTDVNYLEFDESSHRRLNAVLSSANEARWFLSGIDGTPRDDIAPDIVAGGANAAIHAASRLHSAGAPGCDSEIVEGTDFVVQSSFEVDALALYDLPDCLAFKVTLPAGVKVKAIGGAPQGSLGFAGGIVDSASNDDAWVPTAMRETDKYSGYVLVLPSGEIEKRLDPTRF